MNAKRKRLTAAGLLMLAACAPSSAIAADGTIYRCHALDNSPIFQDQPCAKSPGTREARDGREGEVVPNAPPPAEDGAAVSARYQRFLDQKSAERREQAAADDAEAARLRAQTESQAATAALSPALPPRRADCEAYDGDGRCIVLEPAYPVFVPFRPRNDRGPYLPPGSGYNGNVPSKPVVNPGLNPGVPTGPRPPRPPPRVPRDVRAEILAN